MSLSMSNRNPNDEDSRKIIGRDNLGEPIYEGDANSINGNTLDILGFKVSVDPLTASLIIFLLIAFQFFVVANL